MKFKPECRIVIIHLSIFEFKIAMVDPKRDHYEYLGIHPRKDIDKIVKDLKIANERAGNLVSVSERWE